MYSIEKLLVVLPYLSWGILFFAFLALEVKVFKEKVFENSEAALGCGAFIPPKGNGYEHYVSSRTIVYILQKGRNRYRIYLIQGMIPNARFKRDRYGSYISFHCPDFGTAEKMVDRTFRPARGGNN